MATLQLNGKTLATQASSAEPVLGSNLTFPSGHVIQSDGFTFSGASGMSSSQSLFTKQISITSGNKVVVCFTFIAEKVSTTSGDHGRFYIEGATGSGLSAGTAGKNLQQAFGYKITTGNYLQNISGQVLTGATSTSTPTYSVYYYNAGGSPNITIYTPHLVWFEIQQ